VASGRVKMNFSLSIEKMVEFLMKLKKGASMNFKELSAEFKVGTTTIYG
jgi:hypothetical protein